MRKAKMALANFKVKWFIVSFPIMKATIQTQHNSVLQFNELLKENEIRATEQAVNTLINEVFANKNRLENLQLAQSAAIIKLKEFKDKITEEHTAIADTRVALEALYLIHTYMLVLDCIKRAKQFLRLLPTYDLDLHGQHYKADHYMISHLG